MFGLMDLIIVYSIFSAFICAFFSAWLAKQKNYNDGLWFFLGLLFNVLALITLAGAPIRHDE